MRLNLKRRAPAGTPVRLRARTTFQSVKGISAGHEDEGVERLGSEAEFFCRAQAGVEAPEVDSELAGDGDDGFLARGAGGSRSFGEDGEPLVNRWIGGLEANQSPGQFDQCGAQPRVPVLGDRTWHAFGATGVFARTESGVAADLAAVAEAVPLLAAHSGYRQTRSEAQPSGRARAAG